MSKRRPLSADAIVDAAVAVADRSGIAGVSMRNVGGELGVEAMSLYHHVANKDALVDALVEWIFARIEVPQLDDPWRAAMEQRAASARAVLSAHPWALGLIESRRNPGPMLLRHHDRILGCLRNNGFSVELAAHAFSVIDAYVYGFVLSEANLPFEAGEPAENFVAEIESMLPAADYPFLVELIGAQVIGKNYSLGNEFGYGLALILDGLERALKKSRSGRRRGR